MTTPSLRAIYATASPSGARWRLFDVLAPGARSFLLGWQLSNENVDAGPTEVVARLLSEALTSNFAVCYLADQGPTRIDRGRWQPWEGAQYLSLHPSLGGRLTGKPVLIFRNSSSVAEVSQLFETGLRSWVLGAQLALLWDKESPRPNIEYDCVHRLMNNRVIEADFFERQGIEAIMLPGVDGDFAHCVARSGDTMEQLANGVRDACARHQVPFKFLSETEFSEVNWISAAA